MQLKRRHFLNRSGRGLAGLAIGLSGVSILGCVPQRRGGREPSLVWGRRGISSGRFLKPRAMVISPADELYVVDMTGRIQVFDVDGKYLRGWRTPIIKQGRPTGLAWSNDNNLLVADTHCYRVLFYSPDGVLDSGRTIGGEQGDTPGKFHFVTDVAQDARGHFFVGQYGQIDQIQHFDADGQYVARWGSQGSKPGEFSRPQGLLVDHLGLLWVADASNHRVQVFDVSAAKARLVDCWGQPGNNPGQLQYPYGIDFDTDGSLLVAEYGNHRVQRFSRAGESIECWGTPGTDPGEFMSPWALGLDSKRNLHVLDTMNHRMQRYDLT